MLAAGEEPVDRALLIIFQMVGIEALIQIAVEGLLGGLAALLAQGIGNKVDVLAVAVLAVDALDEADHTGGQPVLQSEP